MEVKRTTIGIIKQTVNKVVDFIEHAPKKEYIQYPQSCQQTSNIDTFMKENKELIDQFKQCRAKNRHFSMEIVDALIKKRFLNAPNSQTKVINESKANLMLNKMIA